MARSITRPSAFLQRPLPGRTVVIRLVWVGAAAAVLFLALTVLVLTYIRAWPWAIFFLALSAGSIAIGNLVKFRVGRERPPWVTHEAP